MLILNRLQDNRCEWIGSSILDFEVSQIPDPERKRRVQAILALVADSVVLETEDVKRASALQEIGFKAIDAMHLACAEKAGCNVFLTTDDSLLRAANRNVGGLHVRVLNPADWLREVPSL